MKPKISVVVPVYNVGKYLRQCLDSVINQTYRNLEILVVDDGSTDGSGSICDEYSRTDDRIQVFHTENRGLSAARNHALDRATGEYLAFIDSDDWFEENAIERFLETARDSNADIVACQFYQEYKDKTIDPKETYTEFTVEGEDILKTMVIDHKMTEDVWNKFYKADLFKDIRYPEGMIFEDKAVTYKLLQRAERLACTPAGLIHYRNRQGSISNIHSMRSLLDYWAVYRERFDDLSPISEQYYRVALDECICAISRMWRWYAGCSSEEKRAAKEALDEMQEFLREHKKEILNGSYSKHTKAACYYAMSRNPLVFKALYLLNSLYRNRKRNAYFEK